MTRDLKVNLALALSAVAAFAALGGPSYAARLIDGKDIKRNSIGSAQIRKDSITAADLARGSVRAAELDEAVVEGRHLAPSLLGDLRGPAGATGAAGERGPQGPQGERGPQGPPGDSSVRSVAVRSVAGGETAEIASHGPWTLEFRCQMVTTPEEQQALTVELWVTAATASTALTGPDANADPFVSFAPGDQKPVYASSATSRFNPTFVALHEAQGSDDALFLVWGEGSGSWANPCRVAARALD